MTALVTSSATKRISTLGGAPSPETPGKPVGAPAAEIERILADHPEYAQHAGHAGVERLVVVPGRIVNIILS